MKSNYSEIVIELAEKDLAVREKLRKENKLSGGYHPEMEKVHKENAKILKEIIGEIGYPTISKVGEKASDAAWLIVQHSIGDPDFMKKSYKMMLENKSDISPQNLAYLFDRIQFFQGKPQKFGTQLNADGSIYPVLDKLEINKFRIAYNLPELKSDEIEAILPVDSIKILEQENPNFISWRNKVGWKK